MTRRLGMTFLLFLLVTFSGVTQSWFSLNWSSEAQSRIGWIDRAGALEVESAEQLEFAAGAAHPAAGVLLHYGLGVGLVHSPQGLDRGRYTFGGDEFALYPALLSVGIEAPPARFRGLWFAASLGRLVLNEPSGLLLADGHPVDGGLIEFRFPRLYWSLGAGYLGLLDKRVNQIRLSAEDQAELTDPVRYGAPERVLITAGVEAASPLLGQDAAFLLIGQIDAAAAPVNTLYAGVVATGPIAERLAHSSVFVLGLAGNTEPAVSVAGSHEVAYVPPVSLALSARLGVRYASGGSLGTFPDLASKPVGAVFAEPLSDVVAFELGGAVELNRAPAQSLWRFDLASRLFLTPSGSPSRSYGFVPSGIYQGIELELGIENEPVGGLELFADGGVFFQVSGMHPFIEIGAEVSL